METKLGLCIQEVFNGEKRLFESQPNASWIKGVVDIRSVAIGMAGIESDTPFLLISHSEEGVYVISGLTLSGGRTNDYFAAWIFIPKAIVATYNDNLSALITELQDNINKYTNSDSDDITPFEKIAKDFKSCSYDDKTVIPSIPTGEKYAVRYIDKEQQAKLLTSEYLLQPSHSKYKGVFLIPKSEKNERCKLDEVKENLLKVTFVQLDSNFPKDITVYDVTNDKKEIEQGKKYLHHAADTIKLLFDRKSFSSLDMNYTVKENDNTIKADKLDWKITISKDMFAVTDKNGKPVEGFLLRLGNEKVSSSVEINESLAKNITVEIQSENFEVYRKALNIFGKKIIHIELNNQVEKRTFKVKNILAKNKNIDFLLSVEANKGEQRVSPIAGYKVDKQCTDRLVPYVDYKNPKILIPIIASAIVGIVLGILVMLVFNKNSQNDGEGVATTNDTAMTIQNSSTTIDNKDTIEIDTTKEASGTNSDKNTQGDNQIKQNDNNSENQRR